jgi:hypothetical protein
MPEDSRDPGADPTSPGPSSRRRPLVIAAVIVLVAGMAAHLVASRAELGQLRQLSVAVLLAAAVLQVSAQLAWNGALLLPLRLHMKQLGFWELLMVRAGGFLVGVMVPLGGNVAVRLTYLRRRGLAYKHFTWATLLTNALALVSIAGVAVFAVATMWRLYGRPPAAVLGLTGGVLAAGIGAVSVANLLPRAASHPWVGRWKWTAGLDELRATPRVLAWIVVLALARHLGNFFTFGLLYRALSSGEGTLLTGGLVYALTSPLRIVQIVPGNVGVNEWMVAVVGGILSYDLTTGLLVAVVFRAMALLAQGLGALAGGAWLAVRGGG